MRWGSLGPSNTEANQKAVGEDSPESTHEVDDNDEAGRDGAVNGQV